MGSQYPTPDSINPATVLRLVEVSIDLRLWGAVSDAIDSLSNVDSWQQNGTLLPEEVASYFFNVAWKEREMSLAGMIFDFAGSTVPDYALLCDGSTYLRIDYPILYDAIDPVFKIDPDHFNVPDYRDRTIIGAGVTHLIGDTGGADTHTLTVPELPAHTHTDAGHTHTDAGHTHTEIAASPALTTLGAGVPEPGGLPLPSVTGIGFAAIQTGFAAIQNTGSGTAFSLLTRYGVSKKIIITR